MRNPFVVAAFLTMLGAGVYMVAQTNGSSTALSNSNTCPAPAKGLFATCKPMAGGPLQWTDEGSPYANWPPVAPVPTSLTCDFTLASGGKATLSNCK